ncbi:MAG: DHH family phosphoesterase [Oscillibacter sp.]|nr:DHH family phosphoesterase [Oscillibacter sp.]
MKHNPSSRLLEPNMRLYFLFLLLFAGAALFVSPGLAALELSASAALYFFFRRNSKQRRVRVLRYIDSLTGSVETAGKSSLINSPLPTMVLRPDTEEIIWSNESFLQLTGVREGLFETSVRDAAPGFPVQWLLEGKRECPERVELNGRRFRVFGSVVRAKGKGEQNLVATTYWIDTTDADAMRKLYEDNRTVVGLLVLDNYEDLMKACPEAQRSAFLAKFEEKLNAWASSGLLVRTQRDRYLYIFEQAWYERLVEEKFSILDSIHEVKAADSIAATLSIGIGVDAGNVAELYKSANVSLEMALSRGGDQAVVRNKVDFEFYGGRSKTTEKRTKVKSRVMATALSEMMSDAKEVYVMGHRYSDMDAVGAAAGICCAIRKRGKTPHVVINAEQTAAKSLLDRLRPLPEYEGVFMNPDEAFLKLRPGALLVVVDTNRPEMVESPDILESCNRVAVIDHHRRAATYIENPAFSFHEPYASSASELVTELLQYMVNPDDLLKEEAEALLAGIVLDTKHFAQRTGGRTFEAAAFLRRSGADTENVQKLFQSDLQAMIARYGIIRQAELYRGNMAIAAVDEDGVDRVTAAMAADELMTLKGVQASFVLFRAGEGVQISARSMGEVNVQMILEPLGGGGNSTVAGCRIDNGTVPVTQERLMNSIDAYFEK